MSPLDDTADPFAGLSLKTEDQEAAAQTHATPKDIQSDPSDPFGGLSLKTEDEEASTLSATGALATHAALSAAPTATGFVGASLGGAAAGALYGAVTGAEAGAVTGPGALLTGLGGALIGGFIGASAGNAVQSVAVSKLPQNTQDWLGISPAKQKAYEEEFPKASLVGEYVPVAMLMSPFAAARGGMADSATIAQKNAALSTVAQRAASGVITGGIDLGQQAVGSDPYDWRRTAAATAFGTVFYRTNSFGERLGVSGPTILEAINNRLFTTEAVRAGTDVLPEATVINDSNNAAHERALMDAAGLPPSPDEPAPPVAPNEWADRANFIAPDIHEAARLADPETFEKWDALDQQEREFQTALDGFSGPPQEAFDAAHDKVNDLRTRYYELMDQATTGYTGSPASRRLRVEARGVGAEILAAEREVTELDRRRNYANAGRAQNDPDYIQLKQHLTDTQREMNDLVPQVTNAYRAVAARKNWGGVVDNEGNHAPLLLTGPADSIVAPGQTAPFTEVPPPVVAPEPTIVDSLRSQLVAAGRSPEEATAAGQLESAFYTTLAKDFGVSPAELYARESSSLLDRTGRPGPKINGRPAQGAFNELKNTLKLFQGADASTVIHEKGHEYLSRMLRFAGRDDAPQDFKDRAQKVLDWLGAKSPEEITRGQHEKFANTFVQYVRNGTAPSAELTNVFSRFKTWLDAIYATVKRFNYPVNDEIKGVFDRMLSRPDQGAVVAAERERPPNLAEQHEATHAETHPSVAEAPADRIVAEATEAEARLPQKVIDESAKVDEARAAEGSAQPAGEAAAGPGERGQMGPGSAVEGPEPGGVGGGAEPVAVVDRGGRPVPESAGLPGGNGAVGITDGSAADAVKDFLAKRPEPDKSVTPTPDPGFTKPNDSKLWNILIRNITNKEDLAKILHAYANEHPDGPIPGPASMADMRAFADRTGYSLDLNRLADIVGNMEETRNAVFTLNTLISDTLNQVHELTKKIAAEPKDEDRIHLVELMRSLDVMLPLTSKARAEYGRGLGMTFNSLDGWKTAENLNEFMKAKTGRDLFQLDQIAELAAALDTPAKMSRFLQNATQRSFGKMLVEYWINGLISGTATHTTYMVGNILLNLHNAGIETAVAGGVRSALRATGHEATGPNLPGEGGVVPGEWKAKLGGFFSGTAGGAQAGLEAVRSGQSTLLPGQKYRGPQLYEGAAGVDIPKSMTNAPTTWKEVGAQSFGLVRGMLDGITSTAQLIAAGGEQGAARFEWKYSDRGQIPDAMVKGVRVPIGSVIRAPGNVISGIHSFFTYSTYSMEINAWAYRAATEEGLSGPAFESRVAQLRQDPTPRAMEKARAIAYGNAMMGKNGKWVENLSKLVNTEFDLKGLGPTPLMKFIDPFIRVASNIIDQSIVQRTPVGLLSPDIRAALLGQKGNVEQDMAASKMLVGTTLAMAYGSLKAMGYITGSAPIDPKKREIWQRNFQQYSVKIGDMWYDMHRLGPLGMHLGIAADLYDSAHLAGTGEYMAASAAFMHAITQNILDASFLKGPSDLIMAVEDPGRYGQRYISNMLSSFLPFSVGESQMARAIDPYSRRARTLADAFKVKIPFESENLLPNIDIWGQPIPNRHALGGAAISAIYEQKAAADPVDQAMWRSGTFPARLEPRVMNVKLTEQEYAFLAWKAGTLAKQRLDPLVASPDFQAKPGWMQRNQMNSIIVQSREMARQLTAAQFPRIRLDSTSARLTKLRGPAP